MKSNIDEAETKRILDEMFEEQCDMLASDLFRDADVTKEEEKIMSVVHQYKKAQEAGYSVEEKEFKEKIMEQATEFTKTYYRKLMLLMKEEPEKLMLLQALTDYKNNQITFHKLLNQFPKDDLLWDAKNVYHIKGISKMKKAELIDKIVSISTNVDFLADRLAVLPESEFLLFQKIANNNGVYAPNDKELDTARNLEMSNLAFFAGNDYVMVIPKDILSSYSAGLPDGFNTKRQRRIFVRQCLKASSILYGVFDKNNIKALTSLKYEVTDETLSDDLDHIFLNEIGIVQKHGYLMLDSLDKKEGYKILLEDQAGKPRYIPTIQEIHDLNKYGFPIRTKQAKNLIKTLQKLFDLDRESAITCTHNIYRIHNFSGTIKQVFDYFGDCDLIFESERSLQDFLPTLMDFFNSCRLMSNNGYTPEELMKLTDKSLS